MRVSEVRKCWFGGSGKTVRSGHRTDSCRYWKRPERLKRWIFYVYEMAFSMAGSAEGERGTADISVSECVPGTFPGCGRIYQTTAGLIGKYQIDSRYLIFSDHGECLHSQYRCGQPDERDASRRTDPDLNG